MSFDSDIESIKSKIHNIATNAKVSRFSYTENAYTNDTYAGVETFDINNANNIPLGTESVMNVNSSTIVYGFRSQASTISRMLVNHFFGRVSYNLNKIYDVFDSFLYLIKTARGSANGFASLDQNGRVPVNQLPLDTLVYVDDWNASTNTPHLEDGDESATKGDFYIVAVAGTQTFGGITYNFLENDRVVYGASGVWKRLSGGDVKTVNSQLPSNGNVNVYSTDIEVSPSDSSTVGEVLDGCFKKSSLSFDSSTGILTITN